MNDYAELKAAVLARFEGYDYDPAGPPVFVWHVHHDRLVEQLSDLIEIRIDWIVNTKDAHEIPIRLDRLRRVVGQLPESVRLALAEGNRLWAEGNRLQAEGDRLRAKGNRLRAEGDRLWAEVSADPVVIALHISECPGCSWDGKTLVFGAADAAGGEA